MSEETEIPHPRQCSKLIGHALPVQRFEAALSGARLHHGWLLTGPKGVGKASFAHLAAHAVISEGTQIGPAEGDQLHHLIAEGNAPGLRHIARIPNEKTGKLRTQISVEQIREARSALTLGSEAHEWRCMIIDAAEEMNPSAANALLKVLEEPPERVIFFLVSHAPGRLLPTIRSRCRQLEFHALPEADLAQVVGSVIEDMPSAGLLAAAHGSAGAALRLASDSGRMLSDGVRAMLEPLPGQIDRTRLHALADLLGTGSERLPITAELLASEAAQRARAAIEVTGAGGRAAGATWAELAAHVTAEADRAIGLNLDPRLWLLDMVVQFELAARKGAQI